MSKPGFGEYRDWKGWSKKEFGQCDVVSARYFALEMSSAGLSPLGGLRLLEIGFGNGEFAQWSSQQGVQYVGTEMLNSLVSAGNAAGFRMYSSDCNLVEVLGADCLDGVVAFDVFEHLELADLHQTLRNLGICLKPGGRIFGRVPSGDSPFARAIQYGDVTHKMVFGSSSVRQIAMASGLEVLQIREPAFPVLGLGLRTALRRGLVRLARSMLFPMLRTVFVGDSRAVLTPNMVFVLRKPT